MTLSSCLHHTSTTEAPVHRFATYHPREKTKDGAKKAKQNSRYDDESLLLMDRKLCDYFLPDDSIYYDDSTNKKSVNPEKPTSDELSTTKRVL
eukprot:scaffold609_cov198-Alexandrium_tamarense.AAC.29